ncbi:MAG: 7-carboxy-7-deazaguanine synthase QueE [Bacteroidota bacterium]
MPKPAQLIEKDFRYGAADPLPVMEQFYTLQGEGSWTGTPAYFIRLAGCDVGCTWCDVKESWTADKDQHQSVEELAQAAADAGADRVVITGGEPTIYDLTKLTKALHGLGMKVHIETAGVHPLQGDFDWVCLSPKKFKAPIPEFYAHADELKVIIFHDSDFDWAETHAQQCPTTTQLFLQPEWSRRTRFTGPIVAYAKAHPRWRLSLQTHKWIEIP